MVVETVPPAAVTEHLSRYMNVLRTRGSSVHSLQEGIGVIDFDLEQPHRHDFYQLLWFERGVGCYQIDFVERPLTDHYLHLVTPGHVHWYKLDPAREGLMIVLGEQFFLTSEENRQLLHSLTLFLNNLYFQPLTIAADQAVLFTALAQQILLEKQQKAPYKSEIIRSHLGFPDPAYFSRFFNQQSGQTLSQFRSMIRKKSNPDRS